MVTGVQLTALQNSNQGRTFCEHDIDFKRPNSRGELVATQALVEFCLTYISPLSLVEFVFQQRGHSLQHA